MRGMRSSSTMVLAIMSPLPSSAAITRSGASETVPKPSEASAASAVSTSSRPLRRKDAPRVIASRTACPVRQPG